MTSVKMIIPKCSIFRADRKLREQLRVVQNQNHFLNEEVRKLSVLRQQEQLSQQTLYK